MKNDQLKKIKVLILDVDGVLTDGGIIVDEKGRETKVFDVQDGLGIVCWQKLGYEVAIISSRKSGVVAHRAKDLKIKNVYVNVFPKLDAYIKLLKKLNTNDEEICFIGDDLPDLGILKRVGFPVTVPAGVKEVKDVCEYITENPGGRGAVREVIELILKAQGKWADVVGYFS